MMRKSAIALIFSLSLLATSISAQDLIVNNGECVIPLRASTTATIDPSTGDIRISSDAQNLCGGVVTGPAVALSVSPSAVASNDVFSVSWAVAPSTTSSCTASGGGGTAWTSLSAADFQQNNGSGTRNYALTNTGPSAVTVSFTLTCTFQSGSVPARAASVTINPPGTGTGCDAFTPPGAIVETTFESIFPGATAPLFPGTQGSNRSAKVQRNTILAVRFVARGVTGGSNAMPLNGGFLFLNQEAPTVTGPTSVSLKRCKGDFRNLGDGCNGSASFNFNGLSFSVNPNANAAYCKLTPGETYFINVINAIPPNLTQSTCPEDACVVQYQRTK